MSIIWELYAIDIIRIFLNDRIILGRFCYYDFGKHENIEKYGVHPPPSFNVENITIPIVTYWGDNDWLAEPVVCLHAFSE